jgi:hypothetical protein
MLAYTPNAETEAVFVATVHDTEPVMQCPELVSPQPCTIHSAEHKLAELMVTTVPGEGVARGSCIYPAAEDTSSCVEAAYTTGSTNVMATGGGGPGTTVENWTACNARALGGLVLLSMTRMYPMLTSAGTRTVAIATEPTVALVTVNVLSESDPVRVHGLGAPLFTLVAVTGMSAGVASAV